MAKLPKSLIALTLPSKLIALFLFVTLLSVGFYSGVQYQKAISPTNQTHSPKNYLDSSNWINYVDPHLPFSAKIPPSTKINYVPSGFDNGYNYGTKGLSRIEFVGKNYFIYLSPQKPDSRYLSLSEEPAFSDYHYTQLRNDKYVLFSDNFLPEGGKYGLSAAIAGKALNFEIWTGLDWIGSSNVNRNITFEQELIFMEFLNNFQITEK